MRERSEYRSVIMRDTLVYHLKKKSSHRKQNKNTKLISEYHKELEKIKIATWFTIRILWLRIKLKGSISPRLSNST